MTLIVSPALVVGNGPARIIAVTGWMGDHRLFEPFLPLIDKERYSFALLDARGYGSRIQEDGPYTVEQIAEDVVSCADQLGWDHFHMIGHSMAGMSAQRLAIDIPERLLSAVLLAPVPASGAKIDDKRRDLLLAAVRDPDARKNLIKANTGGIRSDDWLEKLRDTSLAGTRPDVLEAYINSWTGKGFADEIQNVNVPVRVIIGEKDPGAVSERLRETIGSWFPDFELRVLSGCGHYPMWEEPAVFSKALFETIA
ncbi:alpha/beta hydrolase [Brucella pseudogrignonensis]|uniref:alpha/beta fold hydrolase n=1 Tax=Brucella pseudogrignonensis TaxID=419475 RepID=UPI0028BBDB20|nr:alpha/beta hydrolase [Brucella pseudogrignonensis]MDT6942419.1 alpha/beta hydrolase [Brucella pseudogrignonensis]